MQFFDHVLVPSDKKHNDHDEENVEGGQCQYYRVLPVDEESIILLLLRLLFLPLLSLLWQDHRWNT